jgi:hypothetical protein
LSQLWQLPSQLRQLKQKYSTKEIFVKKLFCEFYNYFAAAVAASAVLDEAGVAAVTAVVVLAEAVLTAVAAVAVLAEAVVAADCSSVSSG